MKITIEALSKERPFGMAFEASPSDTVASVKARVEAADDGLRHYQQKLLWSGKQLQSLDATLGSYGMRDDGVYKVYLYRTFPPPDWIPFMLEVRTRSSSFKIEVRPKDTMVALKAAISRAKEWTVSDMVLVFADTETVKGASLDESSFLLVCAKVGTELWEELGGRTDVLSWAEGGKEVLEAAVGKVKERTGGVGEGEGEGEGEGGRSDDTLRMTPTEDDRVGGESEDGKETESEESEEE